MDFVTLINDPRIQRILTHPEDDGSAWRAALAQFLVADVRLTRQSAGESAIGALQRLMIFLGYSTAASGAFLIDGDFGRGTNRGIAQFKYEHRLSGEISRVDLCYPCQWNSARRLIDSIPDATLDQATLRAMLQEAIRRCEQQRIMAGDFELAIFHLNALQQNRFLDCRAILERYGAAAESASRRLRDTEGVEVRSEWVLSIIRQETAGIIRPRFEQHYLSRLNRAHPDGDLAELRMRSMSLGLGQIIGSNYRAVGAPDAGTLFTAPLDEQVAYVARFLKPKQAQTRKRDPAEADFHQVARFYNGPQYAAHHYHERLARWFREFRLLMS
ncbi:N-acetylmuramidase domain-containing protein [Sedimenticola hydrogenitrophicus]|uniref:N-acetylmuramidase domain-containing protein n=1 Tax=Sedimenticola hydrogenitrophicus TaxID=2967975 RepID=UPI0023B03687|nr:N-acetylmuramidase domain-containing protein [Sedimenticola hydrogenitrophicus]